jgi:hypothetical protein
MQPIIRKRKKKRSTTGFDFLLSCFFGNWHMNSIYSNLGYLALLKGGLTGLPSYNLQVNTTTPPTAERFN